MTERSPIPRPVARKGAGHGVILPGCRASHVVQGGVRAEVLAALYTGVEYWRSTAIGAPPTDPAQYDGDQRTPFQKQRCGPPYFCASRLLDTPFRLFTSFEPATFGGQLFHPG